MRKKWLYISPLVQGLNFVWIKILLVVAYIQAEKISSVTFDKDLSAFCFCLCIHSCTSTDSLKFVHSDKVGDVRRWMQIADPTETETCLFTQIR